MRKINKGLILTIIVIAVLTIYLINVEKHRDAEKENIQQACEQFIDFVDGYLETGKELEKLSELMISNEEAVKIQKQFLETTLEKVQQDNLTITNMNKEIVEITDYKFDGNQVTVSLTTTVRGSMKYLNENNEEKETQNSLNDVYDDIILQQVDGKWKVVYSNLRYTDYSTYYEDTIYMY